MNSLGGMLQCLFYYPSIGQGDTRDCQAPCVGLRSSWSLRTVLWEKCCSTLCTPPTGGLWPRRSQQAEIAQLGER